MDTMCMRFLHFSITLNLSEKSLKYIRYKLFNQWKPIKEPCFLNIAKVSVCWTARPLLGTQMKLLISRLSYNIHESESVLASAIAFAVVQYSITMYSIFFFLYYFNSVCFSKKFIKNHYFYIKWDVENSYSYHTENDFNDFILG